MPHAVVLSSVPRLISAGNSISWRWSDSRFPASEWVLTYSLVKDGSQITIAGEADDEDHLIEVDSSVTAAYSPGVYDWQSHVTKGGERYQVESGSIEIAADFAAQTDGLDARSHVKKVLDALEASIEGRASKTQVQQAIGGVQIQHMELETQIKLRERYAMKYRKEQAAAGNGSSRRTIVPRFNN